MSKAVTWVLVNSGNITDHGNAIIPAGRRRNASSPRRGKRVLKITDTQTITKDIAKNTFL